MSLKINVSSIAAILRISKWDKDKVVEVFENLWRYLDSDTYEKNDKDEMIEKINNSIAIDLDITKLDEELKEKGMEASDIAKVEKEYLKKVDIVENNIKTDLIDNIEIAIKKLDAGEITKDEKNSVVKELVEKSKLDNGDIEKILSSKDKGQLFASISTMQLENKEIITSHYSSGATKKLGIYEEMSAVDLYNSKTGNTIVENNDKPYLEWYDTTKGRKFFIVGKVDGFIVSEDNEVRTLIEIKNRAKRLFNFIPKYEMIQIQTYMKLTNTTNGELVERLGDSINIHPFEYDENVYNELITNLSKHVDFVYDFVENKNTIAKYKIMNMAARKTYLNKQLDKLNK